MVLMREVFKFCWPGESLPSQTHQEKLQLALVEGLLAKCGSSTKGTFYGFDAAEAFRSAIRSITF